MGRKVPGDNTSSIDQSLYFSFSLIGLVACISIITSLCSVRFGRKSSPKPPHVTSSDPLETKAMTTTSPENPRTSDETKTENNTTDDNNNNNNNNNNAVTKELPLPPSMQQYKVSSNMPDTIKRATSERKLSLNLSMNMPRSLSLARNWDKKGQNEGEKKAAKVKTDESVWMKTIILGEKCVPDDEEEPIIYEGKGKKVTAYHPKKNRSVSLSSSSQFSFLDPDALSVQVQTDGDDTKINVI